MNKKRISTQWYLLLFVLLITLTGCNKEDDKSIQLYYAIYNDKSTPVEDNQVRLLFPASAKTQFVIFGGDGHYAVRNSDEAVVDVALEGGQIDITPLSTGNSVVTITDNSGGLYTLNIKVLYRELKLTVAKQDVIVLGDKLSEAQKREIQQKAALTLPVKVNGGFSFVYDVSEHKGHAFVYKDKYGENGVETTFEEKHTETASVKYRSFIIQIDGEEREFVLTRYEAPVTKTDLIVPYAFAEVLTDRFIADYPDVTSVYTQQLINSKTE